MLMLTMCMFFSRKLFFKNIYCELIKHEKRRVREISTVFRNFGLFTGSKFSEDSTSEKLTHKTSSHLVQSERKNHYRPWEKRYVFKPIHRSKEKALVYISLIELLQKCGSVEEQIKVFDSMIKLSEENISKRRSVRQNLEKTLQPYFPSCFVSLIGSSVNGLGMRGADVDLSIQFPSESVNEQSFKENKWLCDEVANTTYSPISRLRTIKKIFESENYDEPLVVIPGRCPILNFTMQDLPCDLSINNRFAFQSTNLMLLCGQLDSRVTPFLEIIIYWAKHSRLVGGPVRFKTYAIFLMALYFLQTRNPPVLPSVEEMFKKTDFLENLDNWSYDVKTYLNQFEISKNSETVEELLREFFFFYRSYDFSHVICTIDSTSVDKKSFTSKVDFSNNFELNSINIQDPLNPAFNVTTGVNWKHCRNFLMAIISVSEKYQDPNCWMPGRQNWGLASLIEKA